MCKIGVGQSWSQDSYEAGAKAAQLACQQVGEELGVYPSTFRQVHPELRGAQDTASSGYCFALVFGDVKYAQQEMLDGVTSVLGNMPMIGCSGAGQISPAGATTGSVVVMILKSDRHIDVQTGIGQGVGDNAFAAGQAVARGVLTKIPETLVFTSTVVRIGDRFINVNPYTFIMLPDGLTGDGAEIVRGVMGVLGPTFQVIGGSAGDDFSFQKTYQYYNGQVYTDAVVGALLVSKIPTAVGVGHGWCPVGRSMVVTKAKGNVIQELDGRPAIEAYKELFGLEAQDLLDHPLGKMALTNPLGIPDVTGQYRLRHPIKAFEGGSIAMAGTIPQDSVVRVMGATLEDNVAAVQQATQEALEGLGQSSPIVAIVFDCGARFMLRGQEGTQCEIEAIREMIGPQVPVVGFFTYGEQAPTPGGLVDFYNETCVIYLIGE